MADTKLRATVPETRCLLESANALKVKLGPKGGGKEVWVPKSAIHDDSEVYDSASNNYGKLVLVPWKAEQLGLELD